MALCHGNGAPEDPVGCCWVNGEPCPLLIQFIDGRVIRGGVDTGSVTEWIASQKGNPAKNTATMLSTGSTRVCGAMADVCLDDPNILDPTKRVAFGTRVANHADYALLVAPHWRTIEARLNLAAGVLDCWNWDGSAVPAGDRCCFREDNTTNSARAAAIPGPMRAFRAAAPGASDPDGTPGGGGDGGGGKPKAGPMTQVRDL